MSDLAADLFPAATGLDMDRVLAVVERTSIPAAARIELLVALGMTRPGAKAVMAAMGDSDESKESDDEPPAPVINVPPAQVTVVPAVAPEVSVHVPPRAPLSARIEIERDQDGKMVGAFISGDA